MPFVFKEPPAGSQLTASQSSSPSESAHDTQDISSLLENTSLTPGYKQPEVHKLDKSPLGSRTREQTQEERRKKALQLQKRSRQNKIEYARRLAFEKVTVGLSQEESDEDDEKTAETNSIDDEVMGEGIKTKGKQHRTKKMKKQDVYRDQVMFAEWLIDVPGDLYENWCVVPCPVGKRCLVISANGQTVARLRSGRILNKFESILPAGSSTYRGNKVTDYCILDCIFDPIHWVFYVLDIMCWKGHPIYDCDTEFRFFWVATKIQPDEMDVPNATNQFYKFQALQAASTTELKNVLTNPQDFLPENFKANVDGYLFYNRETQYVVGTTPLVCWVSQEKTQELLIDKLSM
ncbi:hypothetical protein BGW37DRAFT_504957 [Umbelopsis sp. PMI_123]|nr:hypothetical protein BGW37DRAFT_504957 [Umbelopsis sp. PMI_123]